MRVCLDLNARIMKSNSLACRTMGTSLAGMNEYPLVFLLVSTYDKLILERVGTEFALYINSLRRPAWSKMCVEN